jgi:hypothetical protein
MNATPISVIDPVTASPRVRLVGELDHPDFADAAALLRAEAQIMTTADAPPELFVVAQSRPGIISHEAILSLRRGAPLAGIIALLGSWCEGETRTGRPWPGVERLYWYDFPAWWRRQLALRAAGRCPDWARAGDFGLRIADCGLVDSAIHNRQSAIGNYASGLVVLSVALRETAVALADALQPAGYATLWQPPGRPAPVVRGAVAGIWEGGQLGEREERSLAAFCARMARGAAPVIALLDFPRRERYDKAMQLGVAVVLGKPWLNGDLVGTIEEARIRRTAEGGLVTIRAA